MRIISSRILLTTLKFTADVGPGNISELGSYTVRKRDNRGIPREQDYHDVRDQLSDWKPVRPCSDKPIKCEQC